MVDLCVLFYRSTQALTPDDSSALQRKSSIATPVGTAAAPEAVSSKRSIPTSKVASGREHGRPSNSSNTPGIDSPLHKKKTYVHISKLPEDNHVEQHSEVFKVSSSHCKLSCKCVQEQRAMECALICF